MWGFHSMSLNSVSRWAQEPAGPKWVARFRGRHALALGPPRATECELCRADPPEGGGAVREEAGAEEPSQAAMLGDLSVVSVPRVTHLMCFFSLVHPAWRAHNLTVLPSHNASFVPTNDSAYSNSSATVGEHPSAPHPLPSRGILSECQGRSAGPRVNSLYHGRQTHQ